VFKVLRVCELNVIGHSISSSSLSKWANPNWIPKHIVIRIGLNMVYTFVEMPISILKQF
jgi:hypothetical protein